MKTFTLIDEDGEEFQATNRCDDDILPDVLVLDGDAAPPVSEYERGLEDAAAICDAERAQWEARAWHRLCWSQVANVLRSCATRARSLKGKPAGDCPLVGCNIVGPHEHRIQGPAGKPAGPAGGEGGG